ncbi:DUF1048 domain-containing protein [Leucobacter chromiiresistens]|uniref:DNA-binding ferritin-like protein (Dps family) n=1 Tax=Leucobacter chromiiresistens TaxID=1079994 RepID=A0A1H0Z6G2_9MICO|nr:DUF1048 domain-containing protein [Leucobacter chromiiresistens]SDQ23013.1 DNA-binding ferritin-like protein (Dps family) [Leucobacter chromiiresistens]
MTAKWIETLTGSLDDKKQYKAAIARIDALPAPYREVARALQRYFMYYGMVSDGAVLAAMVTDHADLWERAVLDGATVRDIVGDDPVEFAESFAAAYSDRQWIDKERARLRTAIAAAEAA